MCGICLCMAVIPSCQEKGKETLAEQAVEKEKQPDRENQVYTFVDVYGQKYEAALLADVPKCTYDYRYLKEENGYKYYEEKEEGVSSAIGIDVSEFQGEIDWNVVKESGIEFAIIRLGYRGYGAEGRLVLDERFEQNIKGAQAAGLKTGVYFFSQAVSDKEAKGRSRVCAPDFGRAQTRTASCI